MFEDENVVDPRLIDPDEPIEDLVARVRDRVLAVESEPATGVRDRFDAWRNQRRYGAIRSRALHPSRTMNIALLVVAAAIVGVVVLLQIDGRSRPETAATANPAVTTTTPTTRPTTGRPATTTDSAPTTNAPTAAAPGTSARVVPRAWRARCRVAPGLLLDASAAWACAATPEVAVEVVVLDDVHTARKSFANAFAAVGKPFVGCAARAGEPATWARPSHPDVAVGVFVCGTTPRGAELVWTVSKSKTLVRAVRSDGDVQRLFDWWDALGTTASPL